MWYIILVTAFTNFLLHATTGLQLGVLFQILLIFTLIFHLRSIMVGGNRGQWQIQKILVGGYFKHKTSKIRMSSQKLRAIFRPKSEIQTIFSPKIRWSPKKKRSSPKFRAIFRPDSLRLGWWGGCISTWSQIIRNRGCFFGQNRYF